MEMNGMGNAMEHRSTKLIVILFIGLCVFAATAFYLLYSKPQALTAERVAFLVTEMTKTPDRQQKALDDLVMYGDEAFLLLLPYLNDRRSLATNNVRFITPHPQAVEQYFLTIASSIDELTLRYLCFQTASCDPGFKKGDQAYKITQLGKLAEACRARYPRNEQECHIIVENRG
jgi:hypothetical protein